MKTNSRIPVIALDYSQRHKAVPKELLIDYETGNIYVVSSNDKSIIFDITNKILQKLDSVTGDKIIIEIEGIGEVNLQEYINRLNTKLDDMIIVNDEEKDVYIPKHERFDNYSIESKYSRVQIKNFDIAEDGMIPQKHEDTIRWVYPIQNNQDENGVPNPNDGLSTDILEIEPVGGKLFLRASRRLLTNNLQKDIRVILPRTLDKYTEIYWNVTISAYVPSIIFEDCVLFDKPYQISKNSNYIFKFTTWDAGETWYASLNTYTRQYIEEESESADAEIDTDRIILSSKIVVKGQSIGSYNDGDEILPGVSLTNILAKQFAKQIPPVYVAPSMSITSSPATQTFEAGTQINPTITSIYNKADAGKITSYVLDRIVNGDTTNLLNITEIRPYQQSLITVQEGALLKFTGIIDYADGPIKDDNLGKPYPSTSIKAGRLTSTITYTGQRKAFYGRDKLTQAAETSENVRKLPQSMLNPVDGSKLVIKISTGDTRITFAYPSHLRDVTSVISSGLNLDVKGTFKQTKVLVEGANGYTAKEYKVYTYIPDAAFATNDTYTVTI